MVLSNLPPPPYDADATQEPVHQHATVPASLSGEDDHPVDKNEEAWFELLKLAAKFEIQDLRIKCRDRILSTVTKDNALRVLFTVGYRFSDMKEPIMKILVSQYREIFAVAESSLALEVQDSDFQAFDNVGYELDKFGKNAAYELDKFGKNAANELDKFGKNVANFLGGW
ncbi:hypothetical protein BGZ70_001658 [Mortierella alpina]|uniref:BTB domain-containing protein n=1 Tax=Mortierella alpina TaxID=64518 RepID=A0A9P6LXW9_MORAP|nr:hypothetical protein BGZ70_001658 [Mortierella alpina]